ncbi:MAG: proteasome-activating nucleotidase, partial [archaeon]|nr:proteasome-activating nucleotidase [archaeon]
KEIFKIHTAALKLKKDVDLDTLAALTEHATGADIKAISVEAGMFAARKNKKTVGMEEFERAIKKVKESKQWDYLNAKEAGVMFV